MLEGNKKMRKRWSKVAHSATEFFRVEIADGVQVDAWCVKPPDFDPAQKYPLLVYVYGEPAGQTTQNRWGGSRHLWHSMLAQSGYVIMSFDNRGSPAPRGRAWRKTVHRQVGILAPEDQAAAVRRVLDERPWLDRERVGVWGWSGGGSMTLHALFKFPELYQVGISVAPVPNQRHYDTVYMERYQGLPADNPEGYLKGSPIHFASGLEGKLLLIHGTGDDNCHYQGIEALTNELIRHRKEFSMMAYPNRTHAIQEGEATTLHLMNLITSFLRSHLPAGPRD
jgi:dipeptidyl-peptidase-4